MMPRRGFMDVMNKRKWRVYSHQKLELFLKHKTSLLLELWGGSELSTSKSGGIEVPIFEGNVIYEF